jgi:preprotein translocase subunit SecG
MQTIVLTIHVLLAITVIGLVLIQQGKGADAGAAFGSGSSATVFGAGGTGSFLTRMTTAFATLFFATSLGLAVMAAHRDTGGSSVLDRQSSAEESSSGAQQSSTSELPAQGTTGGASGSSTGGQIEGGQTEGGSGAASDMPEQP